MKSIAVEPLNRTAGVVLLAVLAAILLASHASAEDKEPTGILVTGHGEVNAAPDIAYVSLGIVTRDKSARQAATENARIAQAIATAVRAQGVAEKDIRTQNYSIQPWMQYQPNTGPKHLGYEVGNTVRITVRNIKKLGDIIDAGVGAGANSIQGVSFDVENPESVQQKAIVEAVRNARERAETIAKTLDVKVGPPVYVSTTAQIRPQPVFEARAAAAPPAGTPISPGQMTIIQDVTVRFAIL